MRISLLDKLAKKRKIFTFEDALLASKLKREVLWVVLSRLEKNGWIERIEKGKYLIIPLGTAKGKYTLHEFVIGSMLVETYSISYWSALHFYGMTEQIPNTVFIQTNTKKKKQNHEIFGVDYKIVKIKKDKIFGIQRIRIDENSINITDKEKTIIDCLDKPQYCGGVVEVAKALNNEELNSKRLTEYAQRIGNTGVIRRLGYLSEILNMDIDLPNIDTRNYLYLDPTMPEKGTKNARWRLIVNLDNKVMGVLE